MSLFCCIWFHCAAVSHAVLSSGDVRFICIATRPGCRLARFLRLFPVTAEQSHGPGPVAILDLMEGKYTCTRRIISKCDIEIYYDNAHKWNITEMCGKACKGRGTG